MLTDGYKETNVDGYKVQYTEQNGCECLQPEAGITH